MRWETFVGLFWGEKDSGEMGVFIQPQVPPDEEALGIFANTRGMHIGQAGGANVPSERPHAVEAPQMRVSQTASLKALKGAQVRGFCAEMQPS
ncbi:hypothetical protein QG37_02861 [Candidozyma auris]|nr:hypothetical protein QG37_02861 [[Candida] auris]